MTLTVLRIRGLPYSATADDVIEFFKDVPIRGGKRGISFPQGPNGRSNGEAFIELDNENDAETALGYHNKHMGRRYIEVFRSDEEELKHAMGWQPDSREQNEYVARLRGLPYDTDKKEINSFFSGLEIAPNGIGLLVDHVGRCTGDAYVQFTSAEMLARAKEKHLEKIGHRYIEIFDSSGMEANMAIRRQIDINQNRGGSMVMRGRDNYNDNYGSPGPTYRGYNGPPGPINPPGYGRPSRPGPYNRPAGYNQRPPSPRGGYGPPPMNNYGPPNMRPDNFESSSVTGHAIRLRGLPYSATPDDIAHFLSPLLPVNIRICYNQSGRPTGEANVDFGNHDEAKEAMKKDREKIGSRYIELFLESTPTGNRRQQSPVDHSGRSYGPPFNGGGAGSRFNGGMSSTGKPRGGYYDSPTNSGMFFERDEYNYPPDDRYNKNIRRESFGDRMEPPFRRSMNNGRDDGNCEYGERDNCDYYW